MKTFEGYLQEEGVSDELFAVLVSMKDSVKRISYAIKTANTGKAGSENVYGEEQMELDIVSNNIIIEEMRKNPLVGLIASEELPDEEKISDGEFGVCFDPLDGSSLVDVNLAVGTIFGVYKTDTFIGVKGEDQLAAVIGVYGPRTTIILSFGKGVVEFVLGDDDKFYVSREDLKVGEGKMFAPGNLRACSEREDYLKLTEYWIREQYTLRYSGGMVPDVAQILLKGKGIFAYPAYSEAPEGKLRLLFECAPMAFLMEQAGGSGSDGKMRILEKVLEKLDQKTPIFVGSKGEVERCEDFLN